MVFCLSISDFEKKNSLKIGKEKEWTLNTLLVRYKLLYQNAGESPSWFHSVWDIMKLIEIFYKM